NMLQIFKDLQPAIEPVSELLAAFGEVIIVAFGGDETQTFGEFVRDTLIPTLENLTTIIEDNKEGLALLLKAFLAMHVILFIVGIILQIFGAFVTFSTVAAIILVVLA